METGFLQAAAENLQFVLVCAAVVFAIVGGAQLIEKKLIAESVAQVKRTRYLTICAMLGALAMLLHLFDFPVPFLAPGFYKLDFSEIPVMVGAFYLGPVGGVIIELVKILLKLVVKGTSTAFVGDLANFIVGCSFIVPACVVYHLRKSKKTAVMGLAMGTAVMTVFGSVFNAVYLLPAFSRLYGMPLDAIVDMGTAVNPAVNSVMMLVLLAVAPLNLLKGILISVPTMVLYKRISKALHNSAQEQYVPERHSQTEG
ncbi:MAG: ECF transporter S component [Lachnospiraceae bacterium]|uniref:ECF transporter S component n=1 Tax=Parablautia sp. Marseille-Q6255 TaxID=3039593 RepID=UPI0024BD32B0|nr:ECF transporter S component [Parablautia sp. Marseille-Q6255]